jgi:glycosyltransferase involved in cell wall biosynthesis
MRHYKTGVAAFSTCNFILVNNNKSISGYDEHLNYSVYRILHNSQTAINALSSLSQNRSYDVVNCQDYFCVFLADYIRRTYHWPIVTTIHTGPLLDRMMGDSFRRNLLANSIRVIYTSTYVKKNIHERYGIKAQNYIIPCGILIDDLPYTEQKPAYITFCGRLRPNKGCPLLIEAFSQICDLAAFQGVSLHIIGDGEMKNTLVDMVYSKGLKNRVQFLGTLPYEESRGQIRNATVHVIPSLEEAFGLTGLEAMAEKTCLIVSDAGGMTDYVEDGKNGLIFESGNTNQLADKLLDLLTHPDKRRCLADSGYQTVQSFSWQAVAINIMDIFRQI